MHELEKKTEKIHNQHLCHYHHCTCSFSPTVLQRITYYHTIITVIVTTITTTIIIIIIICILQ